MNFSEPFKQTNKLCSFSPNGQFIANASQYRLVIRDASSLQIVKLYKCLDLVEYIEWSLDSEFILCAMYSRALVQVWSISETEWTCKIDEGSAGLLTTRWSQDSRHILTTAEFHLRITVWSLVTKSVSYIRYPKSCQQGIAFSHSDRYLALVERRECVDYVAIFDSESWQLIKHFETATSDLEGISWSPDDKYICIWENSLQYNVLLYLPNGTLLAQYKAYDFALGVKCVTWSPSSQFLAVGSYDEKIRLLNNITWSCIFEHKHTTTLDPLHYPDLVAYREEEDDVILPADTRDHHSYGDNTEIAKLLKQARRSLGDTKYQSSRYNVVKDIRDLTLASIQPSLEQAFPKLGVGTAKFSADSKLFFTINGLLSIVRCHTDTPILVLNPLMVTLPHRQQPINRVRWDPIKSRLALCTANNKVYIWSEWSGCLTACVPVNKADFTINQVTWSSGGRSLLLMSADHFVVCFLTDPTDSEASSGEAAIHSSSSTTTTTAESDKATLNSLSELSLDDELRNTINSGAATTVPPV